MAKCGKGCMPECQYFTTGGCISPFNCLYKIEEISAKSAISSSDAFAKGLIAENAALRERLERAIELPVKVGDTVYLLSQTSRCPAGEIVEAKIIDFIGWEDGYKFTAKGDREWFSFLRGDISVWVFTTRKAAETRLAELKRGREMKCPICGHEIKDCQCFFSGTAHPDRSNRKIVVFDHLYRFEKEQIEHLINLQKFWQISYDDNALEQEYEKLLKELKGEKNDR